MQIVIDIPDNEYHQICELRLHNRTFYDDAIRKGTPLPKGHGRLIDADKLWDSYHDLDYDFYEAFDLVDTIIEADKAESEDEE